MGHCPHKGYFYRIHESCKLVECKHGEQFKLRQKKLHIYRLGPQYYLAIVAIDLN